MMKLFKQTFPLLIVLVLFILVGFTPADVAVAGSTSLIPTGAQIQHIYDKAELLSTSERKDIENMCIKFSKSDDIDIIILTHNNSDAVPAKQYIADFYDTMLYKNCVILLVDMAHRDVYIEDYGERAMSIIKDNDIKVIIDKITPSLSNGVYDGAFKKYIKAVDNYVYPKPIYLNVWIHLLVAILIGLIAVSTMAYNAGGKMTAGGGTYLDPNNSGLIGKRDDYIRTQITRIRKPQNNNNGNGGGGGGGVSSGGNSFNGGGGKF